MCNHIWLQHTFIYTKGSLFDTKVWMLSRSVHLFSTSTHDSKMWFAGWLWEEHTSCCHDAGLAILFGQWNDGEHGLCQGNAEAGRGIHQLSCPFFQPWYRQAPRKGYPFSLGLGIRNMEHITAGVELQLSHTSADMYLEWK